MEIILSKQCAALTGSLGKGFGYFIVRRWSRTDVKFRYYSQRSKWEVPADGHLRFIFACAELAQMKTHITDIRVSANELRLAFDEANLFYGDRLVKADAKQIYNAREVLDFKKWCRL
jgi:hypothetical protein